MNYVGLVIGGIVAVILIVAVAYPVLKDVTENQSATSTGAAKTILGLIPTLIIIGALIAVTVFFMNMNA